MTFNTSAQSVVAAGSRVRVDGLHRVPTPVNDGLTRAARRMARERLQPGELGADALAELASAPA